MVCATTFSDRIMHIYTYLDRCETSVINLLNDLVMTRSFPSKQAEPREVRSLKDIPKKWGTPTVLVAQHPVKFREPAMDENYEYLGRRAIPGVDLIAQRWMGGDNWEDASPVKVEEKKRTYSLLSSDHRECLGISSGDPDIHIKSTPTRIVFVPYGERVLIFTADGSQEEIPGEGGYNPNYAIAFDSLDKPYKFPYWKNITQHNSLPAAYRKVP
jgi:hypothetical protein